jgi:hypothetical protein
MRRASCTGITGMCSATRGFATSRCAARGEWTIGSIAQAASGSCRESIAAVL